MPTPIVVELEIICKPAPGLGNRAIGLQMYIFVLYAPPESFYVDVVHPASFAIHADTDAIADENVRKGVRGELTALVGVEYLRCSILPDRFFKRLGAEGGVQRV